MGLAIVHGIVKGNGGFIEVESELAGGSAFFVHIPLAEAAGENRKAAAPANSNGGESILLVDDDEVFLKMTGVMIEMLGYRAVSRREGSQALELVRENPNDYDLVMMNNVMSGLTGIELSDKIREIRPDLPIIICANPGSAALARESAGKSVDADMACKPMAIEELSALIKNTLDRR